MEDLIIKLDKILDEIEYEFNNPMLRELLKHQCYSILEKFKQEGKIYDYGVICDETTNPSTVINNNMIGINIWWQTFEEHLTHNKTRYYPHHDYVVSWEYGTED